MRYGVCFGIDSTDRIGIAKAAGFDFIECGFSDLSKIEDERFLVFKSALEENNIRCEAANSFLPREYKLLGTDKVSDDALKKFIEAGMDKGSQIGLKTLVFGSGGARNIPDGLSYAETFKQIRDFLKHIVSPIAQKYGVCVLLEPLRFDESNFINTLKEGAMLAAASDCDNIAVLADIYHMAGAGDTYDDIRQLKGLIKHGHISYPCRRDKSKRIYPSSAEEYDYRGFISALTAAGCESCSVEASIIDFASEAPAAAEMLKKL